MWQFLKLSRVSFVLPMVYAYTSRLESGNYVNGLSTFGLEFGGCTGFHHSGMCPFTVATARKVTSEKRRSHRVSAGSCPCTGCIGRGPSTGGDDGEERNDPQGVTCLREAAKTNKYTSIVGPDT